MDEAMTDGPGVRSRALNYVLALPLSVEGRRGHDAAFRVAAALCQGFALPREPALHVMRQWNGLRASPPWDEKELEHKIDSALSSPGKKPRGYLLWRHADSPRRAESAAKHWEGVAPQPSAHRIERLPAFSPQALRLLAGQCHRGITLDWLADRSPVPIPSVSDQLAGGRETSRLFLSTLYSEGDRVLVFSNYYSQGDFMADPIGHSWRLGEKPGVLPVPSPLPSGGREGIWFLTAPVSGSWVKMAGPAAKLGRRHEACVSRWPYLLLESDTAEEGLWLRALAVLPLPIAALYTSGGKSVHALVKVDCSAKAEFDSVRDVMRAALCPVGADGAAMTAVRLSRLPGCLRFGRQEADHYRRYEQPRLQRLVYLNPSPPPATALVDLLK